MARMRFWLSFGYRLLAGIITGIALWTQFDALGLSAWRLLETWILLGAILYFLASVVASWFRRKQPLPQAAICPLWQGMILVGGICLAILWLFYRANDLTWTGTTPTVIYVAAFVVPALMLIDWLCSSKKGGWGWSYPFYWLGIVISYCCIILLTAGAFSGQESWAYPYFMLDYPVLGFDLLFWWTMLIVAVVLLVGYVFMLLDYIASGQVHRHIVLPKIKTIVLEEPVVEEAEITAPEETKLAQVKAKNKSTAKPSKANTPAKSKSTASHKKLQMDIIKPVEGLKDRKSAQNLHRNNKSKADIIADIRLQVVKNPKKVTSSNVRRSQPRPNNPKKTAKKA